MVRLCTALCFVVFLGVMSPLVAQDSLKIMTYNLEGMKPGSDPQTRLNYAIQYLKALNPDIIGLQEINETLNGGGADNQAKVIADSLSTYFGIPYYRYYSFTHYSWSDQFREYVGIISKYPVQESSFLQLVTGAFPRKVVWNHINTPLGKINFFNTHLEHLNRDVRVQQVQQIIGYIAQKDTARPAVASFLTGDFNDEPNTAPILLLTNTGTDTSFIDTYRAANPSLQGYTVSAQVPTRRIDFIFYKNTGQLTIDSSVVVMDRPYSGNSYPSDHLGVMTIVKRNVSGIDEGRNVAPDNFELYQNYPNPFNPTTTMSYYLPRPQDVNLSIYNTPGQHIRTLVRENQSAGMKTVVWDGRDEYSSEVASGIYFAQLKSTEYTRTRKLLLLR